MRLNIVIGGICADENWKQGPIMTSAVEVLQIKGVISNLANCCRRICFFSDLEFDNEDEACNEHHGVYAPAHSRNHVLESHGAFRVCLSDNRQCIQFSLPSVQLSLFKRKQPHVMACQLTNCPISKAKFAEFISLAGKEATIAHCTSPRSCPGSINQSELEWGNRQPELSLR